MKQLLLQIQIQNEKVNISKNIKQNEKKYHFSISTIRSRYKVGKTDFGGEILMCGCRVTLDKRYIYYIIKMS